MFIYLIRHGQTVFNADGERFCGSSDVPLTPIGLEQAKKTGEMLREVRLNKIIHSGLRRAMETAQALCSFQSHLSTDALEIEGAFREVGFGEWEGLTRQEVMLRHPDVYRNWIDDVSSTSIPGSDRITVRQTEALERLHQVAKRADGDFAIVAHNTINRLLLVGLLRGHPNSYRTLVQRNACVNILEYTDVGEFRIHAINQLPG